MSRRLPAAAPALTAERLAELRAKLAGSARPRGGRPGAVSTFTVSPPLSGV